MARHRLTQIILAAAALAGSLSVTVGPPAAASQCRVFDVTQDTHGGSLIRMAAQARDGDRLRVWGTCAGTVVIRADIVVQGMGGAVLTGLRERGVVDVRHGASVTLRDLVIARGRSYYFMGEPPAGAGIFNGGRLTLIRSTVRGNKLVRAFFEGSGAGIASSGTLTLIDSVVRANTADQGSGGGISAAGTTTLIDSVVRGNRADGWGGGIENAGTLVLTDSAVRANVAGAEGGGIFNDYASSVALTGSRVTHNTAGAGGGGIWNNDDPDYPEDVGVVTLDASSSVTGNTPDDCVATPGLLSRRRAYQVDRDLYFVADDGDHGAEMWVTDGSLSGTHLVRDVRPGPRGSRIQGLYDAAAVGDTLYFPANDGAHGSELWRTDGSRAGTRLVADMRPGQKGSRPALQVPMGSSILFRADDGSHGSEPWVTDGTKAGTRLVADIRSGPEASDAWLWQTPVVGGAAWFSADDGSLGRELWRSDGTTAGTWLVADISPPSLPDEDCEGSDHGCTVILGSRGRRLFLSANDGVHGREPWVLDTAAVTGPGPQAARR